MVTSPQFTYLRSLPPPQAVEELTFEDIRSDILDSMATTLPDWVQDPDDPLYKAIENFAYRELLIRQRVNHQIRQVYLAFATGDNLDHLGALLGLEKITGETDDEFRSRFTTALVGLSVGTRAAIEANTLAAGVGVDDVQIVVQSNGQDIVVYPATDGAAISSADQATLLAYITDPARIHIGDAVTIGTVVTRAYTMVATITYDSGSTDRVELEELVRASVYEFIDDTRRVGAPVYRAAVIGALVVTGVINVSLTTPSADDAGTNGSIPVCDKSATGVALTFTSIT